jgi:hypothetical protein
MQIIELDLFFQLWRFELSKLHDISDYNIAHMYRYFELGYSPQLFYEVCIMLPF